MPEPKVCVRTGMFHIQPLQRDTLQWLASNLSWHICSKHSKKAPLGQLWFAVSDGRLGKQSRPDPRERHFIFPRSTTPHSKAPKYSAFSNLLNPINVKQLIFTCSAWAARMPALFTPSTSVTVWEELNKHTHSRMHLITHYQPWDKAVTSAGGKLSNETHSANRYKTHTHTQWHAGQLQKSYQL